MATALFFTLTGRLTWTDFAIYWLAFSAGAIVINQAFTKG
jgi:glycerol uptake facilitator-like aquaporin